MADKPKDTIVNVTVQVRTGQDDKECGVFSIRLYQGASLFFHQEYGNAEDWNEGFTLDDSRALQQPVTGEAIRCVVALEERPGQVNITWDADIREIRVNTSADRKAVFSGQRRFDTDHNKPLHIYDMGSQQLK